MERPVKLVFIYTVEPLLDSIRGTDVFTIDGILIGVHIA